eukprot:12883277-Prorocentrum_lima.AAC.1
MNTGAEATADKDKYKTELHETMERGRAARARGEETSGSAAGSFISGSGFAPAPPRRDGC